MKEGMSRSQRLLELRQARTELSFLYGDRIIGGPDREAEMRDLRDRIHRLEREEEWVTRTQ